MAKKVYVPSSRLAAIRIRSLAKEIGADSGYARGWKAEAARTLGLNYQTLWGIITTNNDVGTRVIDQVCRKIGCTPGELME